MDKIDLLLSKANPDLVIFILVTFVAFISWLVKCLIEMPINESKETFYRFVDKRISVLTDIKSRLCFIAYFPTGEDSIKYKKQLQKIILHNGRIGYLDKETFNSVLRIAITEETDEELLLKTIEEINEDLYLQISKIHDEMIFYRKFSNFSPFRKFMGITLLSLQYVFSFVLVISMLFLVGYYFFYGSWYWKIVVTIIFIFGFVIVDKQMRK